MSQTDKLFGALLIAFLIYITARGQLPQYFQLFTASHQTPPQQQDAVSQGLNAVSNPIGTIFGGLSSVVQTIGQKVFGFNSSVASGLSTAAQSVAPIAQDVAQLAPLFLTF